MFKNDMEKQKVLFIYNQNRLRSPTAEKIFSVNPGLIVKSAGITQALKWKLSIS